MSRRKNTLVAVVTTALVLAGVLVTGCSMDRRVRVEPGEYVVLPSGLAASQVVGVGIQSLIVDRDQRRVVMALADGSEIVSQFVSRDRAEWPAGCPSNIHSTRMEILEIAEDPLTFGATTFSHPVLVRDCPRDPVQLVLRQDGAMGGGGSACPYPEPCIYFVP